MPIKRVFIIACVFLYVCLFSCSRTPENNGPAGSSSQRASVPGGVGKKGAALRNTAAEHAGEEESARPSNHPPKITAAKVRIIQKDGRNYLKADVAATDEDGDDVTISYEWLKNGEPAGITEMYNDIRRGDKKVMSDRA